MEEFLLTFFCEMHGHILEMFLECFRKHPWRNIKTYFLRRSKWKMHKSRKTYEAILQEVSWWIHSGILSNSCFLEAPGGHISEAVHEQITEKKTIGEILEEIFWKKFLNVTPLLNVTPFYGTKHIMTGGTNGTKF